MSRQKLVFKMAILFFFNLQSLDHSTLCFGCASTLGSASLLSLGCIEAKTVLQAWIIVVLCYVNEELNSISEGLSLPVMSDIQRT